MDPKLLTEKGWKATAAKYKVKDNGLERALALYEKLEQEEVTERLKATASIAQLAGSLKKLKEISGLPEVTKYLSDLSNAAESSRKQLEVAAAKAATEVKEREAQQKQELAAENEKEAEEEEQGDYAARLLVAFQKLKTSKELSYPFLVCDAKPHCGLMVAKRITSQHREELSRLTGGSKRFLHTGVCHFENGRFVFAMEEPVSGLARKLQDSVKFFTGKKLPIMAGAESVDEEEGPTEGTAQLKTTSLASLEKAPEVWRAARESISGTIQQLKNAIRKQFADDAPSLLAGVEQSVANLDSILNKLDHSLAEALAKAHAAKDAAARAMELKAAKTLLTEHILYVKSEPLIEHIDSNPFGVATNLKQKLTTTFGQMAQAIG
jgi:hypothetical protein